MAKRKLTTLRAVLWRYLLLCGGGCLLIVLLWWCIFMRLMQGGVLLPAVAAAQACAQARDVASAATAETFDAAAVSDLCRWAVVQGDTVLRTNMTDRQLKIALNDYHGGSGNLGITQYQYNVKMADSSFCLLQYDYTVPYANPELRRILPDFQTMYLLLLAGLFVLWLGWITHCTLRLFLAETARMTQAVQAITNRQPENVRPDNARIREFGAALQAMQTMGQELTDSLQQQWRMEQQRTEQIAALAHDLKTPLTIIQGNAELLAEDCPPDTVPAELEAVLRGTDRARQYLAALRAVGAPPAAKTHLQSHRLAQQIRKIGTALCNPAGLSFIMEESWQGGICAAESDLLRAAENLLDNAVRYTPQGGAVTVQITQSDGNFLLRVRDSGPGFSPEALAKAGELLYTGTARTGGEHQGLGLYFVRKTAAQHAGTLQLSNEGGGCVTLQLPICE